MQPSSRGYQALILLIISSQDQSRSFLSPFFIWIKFIQLSNIYLKINKDEFNTVTGFEQTRHCMGFADLL